MMSTIPLRRPRKLWGYGALPRMAAAVALCGSLALTPVSAQSVPPFLTAAEAKKAQAPTASPERFSDPPVRRAYTIAKKMPAVLAQQPCYCWCSRMGHHSLLSCYQDEHASECSICLKEAFLADQLTRQGKTPEQIRQAIMRGDWRSAE